MLGGRPPNLRGAVAGCSVVRSRHAGCCEVATDQACIPSARREGLGFHPREHGAGLGEVAVWVGADNPARCLRPRSSVLSAAVDDQLIARNPCKASSVSRPRKRSPKIDLGLRKNPAIPGGLPGRYAVVVPIGAGLGLRQGEFSGSPSRTSTFCDERSPSGARWYCATPGWCRAAEVQQRAGGTSGAGRRGRPSCSPGRHPALTYTLPWIERDGKGVTAQLICSTREHRPINRNYFNSVWRRALTSIGVEPTRQTGCHALRHFFASVLLDAGE